MMIKVGDNGRFIDGIIETDALKVSNIEISIVHRFHDVFRLTFHESRIHIKIHGHCYSQVTKENGRIVREGKNTMKKENGSHGFGTKLSVDGWRKDRAKGNVATPDYRLLESFEKDFELATLVSAIHTDRMLLVMVVISLVDVVEKSIIAMGAM